MLSSDALKLDAHAKFDFLSTMLESNEILRKNCWQVRSYIEQYSANTGQFPEHKLSEIHEIFDGAESLFNSVKKSDTVSESTIDTEIEAAMKIFHGFKNYHVKASELCRDLWTSFDTWSMTLGVAALVSSLLLLVTIHSFSTRKISVWYLSSPPFTTIRHPSPPFTALHCPLPPFTPHSSSPFALPPLTPYFANFFSVRTYHPMDLFRTRKFYCVRVPRSQKYRVDF